MSATFAADVAGEEDVDDLEADDGIPDAPLVRLVNSMIFEAAEEGASDIHVEPQEDDLIVRYRINDVLRVAHHIPKRLAPGVTTRLKVLAKLDIAERRKPQDGRIDSMWRTASARFPPGSPPRGARPRLHRLTVDGPAGPQRRDVATEVGGRGERVADEHAGGALASGAALRRATTSSRAKEEGRPQSAASEVERAEPQPRVRVVADHARALGARI